MELWMIITKLLLIGYLGFYYVQSNMNNPWIVFSLLFYFSLNIALYLVKKEPVQKIFLLMSIVLILLSYVFVHPLILLLLPLNLYELLAAYMGNNWIMLAIGLLPANVLDDAFTSIYLLVAVFSFLVFTMAKQYMARLNRHEQQLDSMRKDIQKLTKKLHENDEFLQQSEYTFKLEERNRLSQEIHDKIGHSMTGALIQMEAAKHLMDIDKNKAIDLLQNAIHISKEGIESIRMTLKQMKPQSGQIGIHRLKLLLDEFSAKHDMKTPFVYEGNLEVITPLQWKVILENITEALTNTLKYSHGTQVSVDIHVLNKVIRVEVKDNGQGAAKFTKGLGLMGMEERTASINGKIIVDGSNGFSVTTLLPIGQ